MREVKVLNAERESCDYVIQDDMASITGFLNHVRNIKTQASAAKLSGKSEFIIKFIEPTMYNCVVMDLSNMSHKEIDVVDTELSNSICVLISLIADILEQEGVE